MQTKNPTAANIWKETYGIRSYEVNAEGRLSVLTLFNLLQDAASNHADALGVSVRHLQAENLTWVLSRLHLTIDALSPLAGQHSGPHLALRDKSPICPARL